VEPGKNPPTKGSKSSAVTFVQPNALLSWWVGAHEGVYVVDEVWVVSELCRNIVPFSPEDPPRQRVLDLTFPKSPEFFRQVADLVKIVDVSDELDAVQRAVGQFLTGRRKRSGGIKIREPRFGWEQAKEILEPAGKFDEHMDVQLAVLILKRNKKPERPYHEGSRLSKLCQPFSQCYSPVAFQ
jgi:hypothetical protein